ncbi:hypothetical protein DL96DRAFT_1606301 [Flagelloscypha sp. PMI_526]|nr:hypothetical protein DL96DRAFT_1606301 [Flagelloscypha sp. PMI_526]
MVSQSHNEINLSRLVRRLEKTPIPTLEPLANDQDAWFAAQAVLQRVKYAKRLLKDVELQYSVDAEVPPKKFRYFDEVRTKLDGIQSSFSQIPQPEFAQRPEPILPRIPKPQLESESKALTSPGAELSLATSPESALIPSEGSWADSLPSPPITATHLPSLLEPSSSKATTATSTALPTRPTFLQNSQQIQQELSEQLAQMATQLKRNAHHFSKALEDDKAVLERAEDKIGQNLDTMTKTRGNLGTYSSKSRGTTWMTLGIVIFVFAAFIMMIALIRLTRW